MLDVGMIFLKTQKLIALALIAGASDCCVNTNNECVREVLQINRVEKRERIVNQIKNWASFLQNECVLQDGRTASSEAIVKQILRYHTMLDLHDEKYGPIVIPVVVDQYEDIEIDE